jgi:DNA gyrase subunit A
MSIKEGGAVAGALSVRNEDEIMLLTKSGQTVRCPVRDIRIIGRVTQGVRLVNLAKRDKLIGMAKIVEVDEEEA